MINRMTKAAQLDIAVYEEVEHNPGLNEEARNVVLIVSAMAGLGVLLSELFRGNLGGAIVGGIVTAVLSVVQWYLWSYLTLVVGTKMFNGTADFGEMTRTIAYASTPNALRLFAFVPFLGALVGFIAGIWSLVLGVVAVRQALDFDTTKAVLTVVIAAVISFVITTVVALILLIPMGIASIAG